MGVQVLFHDLTRNEVSEQIVQDRIEKVLEKFQLAADMKAQVFISRESSEVTGPDHFSVRIIVSGKRLKPIVIHQLGQNVFQAVAFACDRLLEVMHRHLEKRRDGLRQSRRDFKEKRKYPFNWRTAG